MKDQKAGELKIHRRDHALLLNYKGTDWIKDIGLGIPVKGKWLWSYNGTLQPGKDREIAGEDRLGEYKGYEIIYHMKPEPVIRLSIKVHRAISSVVIETEALRDLEGTATEDSFIQTTFNSPILIVKGSEFLLYSWGLKEKELKGYWPEAIYGKKIEDIPRDHAFAPLVLFDKESTLVISPLNHYLVSPLRVLETPKGLSIARGLHGSIDRIPRGTVTKTIITFGDEFVKTLHSWGDVLLKLGGKERIGPLDHPILERIGYWNDYGAYYAELFSGMDEETLLRLANYFKEKGIPIGYFGLDLWYQYDRVGFAKSYKPNSRKYPNGLRRIVDRTSVPLFLHLSALDRNNKYLKDYPFIVAEESSCPSSKSFYVDLAKELKQEGALGIWHDFLRTHQERITRLRNSVAAADDWFENMAEAFGEKGLAMMLSMPTMGFHLASTRFKNVIAARSYADYLVKQEQQVEVLRRKGEKAEVVRPQKFIKNNILVGMVLHALGIYPFYDVFITNRTHPDGFEEPDAEQEAAMRALSAGLVGIGDKIGEVDMGIVNKLCFPDGRLAKPDHPPYVLPEYLQDELVVSYTTSTIGKDIEWRYLTIFNIGEEESEYSIDTRQIYEESYVIYNYFRRKVVKAATGVIPPAKGHYYVLVPQWDGLAFLGFLDKYVTAPSLNVRGLGSDGRGIKVSISVPPGYEYSLGAYCDGELNIRASGAVILRIDKEDKLYNFIVKSAEREFEIYLQRGKFARNSNENRKE